MASTGVIGEVLPHEKLCAALPGLHASLTEDGWEAAARGIMTTDTFPKASTRIAKIGGQKVRITGKNRDDLQEMIATLRAAKLDVPLQFNNFRD